MTQTAEDQLSVKRISAKLYVEGLDIGLAGAAQALEEAVASVRANPKTDVDRTMRYHQHSN